MFDDEHQQFQMTLLHLLLFLQSTGGGTFVALQDPAKRIPWKLLLSKAPVWALIVSHFCHNWGTFILLTWMPTYYNQVPTIATRSSFPQPLAQAPESGAA